ncbi:MAG: hypothetical protein J3K34DRAFT_445690, partial [Monoraphidium minutum]
ASAEQSPLPADRRASSARRQPRGSAGGAGRGGRGGWTFAAIVGPSGASGCRGPQQARPWTRPRGATRARGAQQQRRGAISPRRRSPRPPACTAYEDALDQASLPQPCRGPRAAWTGQGPSNLLQLLLHPSLGLRARHPPRVWVGLRSRCRTLAISQLAGLRVRGPRASSARAAPAKAQAKGGRLEWRDT